MTLERVCIEQQDIIEKQSAIIKALLYELAMFRDLNEAEKVFTERQEELIDGITGKGAST